MAEETKRRSVEPLDPEIIALNKVSRILKPLPRTARMRIANFFAGREGSQIDLPLTTDEVKTP